jgi:ATP-binding cassette subfamily B protein RaxB
MSSFMNRTPGVSRRQPAFELQVEPADCGYVGISVLLAFLGIRRSVSDLKTEAGTTSRGLSVRQAREILRRYDVGAEALYFDRTRPEAYPCPGLLLLAKGHYVVLTRRVGDVFHTYDPNYGWHRVKRQKLARLTQGVGIEVALRQPARLTPPKIPPLPSFFWSLFGGRLGWLAISAVALTQIAALSLPLLSQRSIDELGARLQPSFLGTVGLGFLLISALTMLTSFVSTALGLKISRRAARRLGQHTFDRLARQPISWFSRTSPASIQYQIAGLDLQHSLVGEIIRVTVTISVTLTIGLLAFLVVSPWLALPGLIGAAISIGVDLLFNRKQLSLQHAAMQTLQRRAALNYDLLTQIPLLARFGALARGRARYAGVVATSDAVDARLQTLRNWRGLVLGLVKSADTLVFVTLSALLMHRGNYSLGAFVALGAYKDLVAQSVLSAFALRQRIKQTEGHRLQTRDLLAVDLSRTPGSGVTVTAGRVEFSNVSFSYGSLDREILRDANLRIEPGQCVVIRGESGIGKSTIARLLCGSVEPSAGRVAIDGQTVSLPVTGFGSVLQEDRLISGSVRENVLLFRQGFDDAAVYAALECAELDEFVRSLPMKLNAQATENSGGLSGGQRQRLLIARALLGDPKLIILDEATASLEVARERSIIERLKSRGTTLVIVSHRPEVWSLADRLLEISEGVLHEVPPWTGGIAEAAATGSI